MVKWKIIIATVLIIPALLADPKKKSRQRMKDESFTDDLEVEDSVYINNPPEQNGEYIDDETNANEHHTDESNDETWNPSSNDYVEVVDIEEEAPDNEAEIIQDTHDKKGDFTNSDDDYENMEKDDAFEEDETDMESEVWDAKDVEQDEDPMFEGGEDFNDENEDMQSRTETKQSDNRQLPLASPNNQALDMPENDPNVDKAKEAEEIYEELMKQQMPGMHPKLNIKERQKNNEEQQMSEQIISDPKSAFGIQEGQMSDDETNADTNDSVGDDVRNFEGDEEEKVESRNDKSGGLADDNTRAGQPMADLVTEMGCKKSTLQDFGKDFVWNCPDKLEFGAYCRLMCAKDSIISGQVYATCTIGGWVSAPPMMPLTCKKLDCPDVKTMTIKDRWNCLKPKVDCPASGIDRLGEVCVLNCPKNNGNMNITLSLGHQMTVCTTQGWAPKIDLLSCPDLTSRDGNRIKEEIFPPGWNRDGHSPSGDKSINRNSVCIDPEKMGIPIEQKNGKWKCMGEKSLESCELQCNKGYRPDKDNIINCVENKWDSPPASIKCVRDDPTRTCDFLPGAEFGSWECDGINCALKCDPGYETIRPVTAKCVNNAWCTSQPGIGCRPKFQSKIPYPTPRLLDGNIVGDQSNKVLPEKKGDPEGYKKVEGGIELPNVFVGTKEDNNRLQADEENATERIVESNEVLVKDENEGDTLPDLNTMDDNGPPLMEGSQGFDMNKFQQPPGSEWNPPLPPLNPGMDGGVDIVNGDNGFDAFPPLNQVVGLQEPGLPTIRKQGVPRFRPNQYNQRQGNSMNLLPGPNLGFNQKQGVSRMAGGVKRRRHFNPRPRQPLMG